MASRIGAIGLFGLAAVLALATAAAGATLPLGTWKALGPSPRGYEPYSCLCQGSKLTDSYLNAGNFGGHNSGRITSVAAIPSGAHAGRVVVGSAGGGIWTSDDNGGTWTARTDQAPSLAIGSLADDPSNPNHLIAGMGEADNSGDSFYGFGILSSSDGGTTWTAQDPPSNISSPDTTYTATSATDDLASWPINQWAGATVTSGGNIAVVQSNTATVLTLRSAWFPSTPSNSTTFRISAFTGTTIHQVAISPADSNTMYAATSTGLYLTTDGGTNWTKPADPSYATALGSAATTVDAVVVDPNAPSTVYIGTQGRSVAKSTDGGTTWTAAGTPAATSYTSQGATSFTATTATDSKAAWVPGQWTNSTVTAGGDTATIAGNSGNQLTLTGAGWSPAAPGPGATFVIHAPRTGAVVALAIAPSTNPSTLYASLGSPTVPVALFKSTNGAASWQELTAAPDYTGNGYAYANVAPGREQGDYDNVVAVDPANANHVLAGGEALVETKDGGALPTDWTNVNGQPFAASSSKNRLHPDQHALAFRPDGKVWVGNDGGLYLYDPAASTNPVANANGKGDRGLGITQFYPGFAEMNGFLFAGSQDNAATLLSAPVGACAGSNGNCVNYVIPPATPWDSQGVDIGDGGGGAQVVDPDPSCVCATWFWVNNLGPNSGPLFSSSDSFSTKRDITPPLQGFPALQPLQPDFIPPLAVVPNSSDPSNPTVLFGGTSVFRTTNPSASPPTWASVARGFLSSGSTTFTASSATDSSASWTPGQWAGFKVYTGQSLATVTNNTQTTLTLAGAGWQPAVPSAGTQFALAQQNVSTIAVSPTSSPRYVYAGFNDGQIWVSSNGGSTFTQLLPAPPAPFTSAYVAGISVDPSNPQNITVAYGGCPNNLGPTRSCWLPGNAGATPAPRPGNMGVLQFSASGGGTWTNVTGDLASVDNWAMATHVIYDNGALIAATDSGVFGTTAPNGDSTHWAKVGTGLPAAQTQDLSLDPATGDLFAVTHGRGAWKLTESGMQAWGSASAGGLADGSTTVNGGFCGSNCSDVPVWALSRANGPQLRGVSAIAAGYAHGLALHGSSVWSWGLNNVGQLGNGTTTNSSVPVNVCAVGASSPCGSNVLTNVKAIAGGSPVSLALSDNSGDSFALTTAGNVVAWGENEDGELGNGTLANSSIPVRVCAVGAVAPCGGNVLSGVTAIAAGGEHNLALLGNGTVVSWGDNNSGQLGNGAGGAGSCGNAEACAEIPVQVSGLANVKAIAAGGRHSLALETDGTLWAWGRGNDGQLGTGTTNSSNVPVKVALPAGAKVATIAAGGGFSVALLSDGTVLTWGDNTVGELGDGVSGNNNDSDVPVRVCAVGASTPCTQFLGGVKEISAEGNYTLALVGDISDEGAVRAWGSDSVGQLGDGNAFDKSEPQVVCAVASQSTLGACPSGELAGATRIAAGSLNSFAAIG